MAFPICDSCASSGILCSKCEKRVRAGELAEIDVLLSTLLAHRGSTGYKRAIDLEKKLIVFASDEEAPRIIGSKGSTASELSKKLGRRLVVIVEGWDNEQIVKSLARPCKVVSMNHIYKKDGKDVLKLIFDKPLDEGTVQVMHDLIGEFEIDYEKDAHVR